MKIYFHDVSNLNEIVFGHSVAPHVPGPMFTSSPTTLLYEDLSDYPLAVRWLDCSVSPPKPASGKNATNTQQIQVWDMCFVRSRGDKGLLITTRGPDGGIYGYDTDTDKLDWIVKGTLPGMSKSVTADAVTTDGRGHLFVCDTVNACVHILSVDGTYLGSPLKAGEQDIGGPWRIRWLENSSSLVVVHIKDLRHHISVVRVEGELEEGELDETVTTEQTHVEKDLTQRHDSKPKKVVKEKVSPQSDAIVIDSSPEDAASATSETQPEYHWKGGLFFTWHLHRSKSQGCDGCDRFVEILQNCVVRQVFGRMCAIFFLLLH